MDRFTTSRILALRDRGWKFNRRKGEKGWTRVAEGGKVLTAKNIDAAAKADTDDWQRQANMYRHCRIEQLVGKGKRAKWVWVASSWSFTEAEQVLFRYFYTGRVVSFDDKISATVAAGEEKDE